MDLPSPEELDAELNGAPGLPSPSELDSELESGGDDPSWWEYPVLAGFEGLTGIGEGSANLIAAGADLVGADGLHDYMKETSGYAAPIRQRIRERLNIDPGGVGDTVFSGISSATAMLPYMAAAPSIPLAIAPMAFQSGANRYMEVRDQQHQEEGGLNKAEAAAHGVASGAITALVEKLPVGMALKYGEPFLKRIVKSSIGEGAEEAVEASWASIADALTRDDLPSAQQYLSESIARIGKNAVGGMIGGGVLGGAGHVISKASGAPMEEVAKEQESVDRLINDLVLEETPSVAPTEEVGAEPSQLPKFIPAPSEVAVEVEEQKTEEFPDPIKAPETVPLETAPATEPVAEVAPLEPAVLQEEPTAIPEIQQEPSTEDPTQPTEEAFGKDVPIFDLPVDELRLSKDVPNFKMNADPKTGVVEPLTGKFMRDYANPIVVWMRLDGVLEVISGRHRWDLAKRSGEKTIKARVVREIDGFTAEDAAILDAELNIRDENGDVKDYAAFFRRRVAKGLTTEQAEADGLISRSKQKRGFAIGAWGTPPLMALHQSGKISDIGASTIAEAAPNDENFQRAGIKYYQDGLAAEAIGDALQALKIRKDRGQIKRDAQGKIFDWDDSIMQEAESEGRRAAKFRQQIKDRVRAVENAAKNPDVAAEEGVDVSKPESVLARVEELKAEKLRWDRWFVHPDLVAKVRGNIPPNKGEAGSFNFHNDPLFQKLYGAIHDTFVPEGRPDIDFDIRAPGILEVQETEKAERYLGQGRIDSPAAIFGNAERYNIKVPVLSNTATYWRRFMTFPKTLAEKFPNTYGKFWNVARGVEIQRHRNIAQLSAFSRDYFALDDKSKVNQLLVAARLAQQKGKHVNDSDEALKKQGFDDAEISAYRGVRRTMKRSLHMMRQGLLADPPDRAKFSQDAMDKYRLEVEEVVTDLEKSMYVPFSRFGNIFVWAPKANEGKGWFSLHEDIASRNEKVRELRKAGYDVTVGEMIRPDQDSHADMHPDLIARLAAVDSTSGAALERATRGKYKNPQGFAKHMVEAQLMPGFTQDLERSIADYLGSLSSWHAHKLSNPRYEQVFENPEWKKQPALHKRARTDQEYFKAYTPEAAGFRQFMAVWYLSRPMSAFINGTQSFTTTIPELTKHDGIRAPKTMLRAIKLYGNYLINKEAFTKRYPELAKDLRLSLESGNITEEMTRELSARRRGVKPGKQWSDYPLMVFSIAEKMNRTAAYIAAHDVSTRKGLKGDERRAFAEKFVDDTQYLYSKVNRPPVGRGPVGAIAITFRQFQGAWTRQLRNSIGEGAWLAALSQLGIMLALGGAKAFPMVKDLLKGLESSGADPDKWVRERSPGNAWADVYLYGLPNLFGLNISGNIAFGELAPGIEQGIPASIVRGVGGVAVDFPQRVGRASYFMNELDNPERAAEQLMPPALRNLYEAYRWARDGEVRDPFNRAMLVGDKPLKPSVWDIGVKALGGTPPSVAQAYEQRHSEDLLMEKARDNMNINHKLAQAIQKGNHDRVLELLNEVAEHNRTAPPEQQITPNSSAIKRAYIEQEFPEIQRLFSAPKKARPGIADTRQLHSQP